MAGLENPENPNKAIKPICTPNSISSTITIYDVPENWSETQSPCQSLETPGRLKRTNCFLYESGCDEFILNIENNNNAHTATFNSILNAITKNSEEVASIKTTVKDCTHERELPTWNSATKSFLSSNQVLRNKLWVNKCSKTDNAHNLIQKIWNKYSNFQKIRI